MSPAQFISALRKGKLDPVYFLRGPDRLLHEECRKAFGAAVPPEARAWCLAEIEFRPGQLQGELEGAHQMPMLGGRNFWFFSDPEDFRQATDEDFEALSGYLESPSPFATLAFAAVEPDRRRRFVQLLERKSTVVDIEPLHRRQATAWLEDYLGQAGVSIDSELAEEIVAKFETTNEPRREEQESVVNLLWMRTETEKLLIAKPGAKRLEREDLELMVAFREEHQIGKLLRAVAERKCGEALEHLRALLASKVAETLLLWCMADLVRQALRSDPSRGYGRQGWYGRGNPLTTPALAPAAVRHYSREELLHALRLVRRADLGIKSSWKDSGILLECLVWQIVVGKGTKAASLMGEEIPALTQGS